MAKFILLLALTVTSCMVSSDAQSSIGSSDSASGLLSLMKIIRGNFNLRDVLKMGSLMKSEIGEVKNVIQFSPVLTSIIHEAAQDNPKIQVLQDVLEDKTPSLKDIFKMATTKSQSIDKALATASKENKKYILMSTIMKSGPINDHAHLKEIVETLFNRKIDEKVVKLKNDKYTVSEISNLAFRNVLQLAYFVGDNYPLVKKVKHILKHNPSDNEGILRLITTANLSNLPTTMVSSTNKNPSPNPDSVQFMNNVKTKYPQILAENDNKKASAAVGEALSSLLKVADEVLTEAEKFWNPQDINKHSVA